MPVNTLHDAVIGVQTAGVQDRDHARADALVLVRAGVENQERLPHKLVLGGAEHFAQVLVAVHNGAVAREHQSHRRQVESELVIHVHGANLYEVLRI